MQPYYEDEQMTLHLGDSLEVLRTLPADSVDAVCTDPPYGLEFMGKEWDRPWAVGMSTPGYGDAKRLERPAFGDSRNANCRSCGGRQRGAKRCACPAPAWDRHPAEDMRAFQDWCQAWAAECLRVLKPGGYLLAFGGTRTVHRLTSGIEDARFEIRDGIDWLYGQGFPKSLNAGEGRGTALKPAREPIVMARKPIAGTVAANVLAYGTGALNIDACRVATSDVLHGSGKAPLSFGGANHRPYHDREARPAVQNDAGRWPTNVVLSHAGNDVDGDLCADGCVPGCPVAELDRQSGVLTSGRMAAGTSRANSAGWAGPMPAKTGAATIGDSGGASRFFPVFRYEAKAPTSERPKVDGEAHSTVKPLTLMRWLVQLVTPPGGTVLEPFAGSGTTVEACLIEGYRCIAVEREANYLPLIMSRISKPIEPVLFGALDECEGAP